MYTERKCGVKINTKRTRYLSQERGVRQGCCLSPTLFNIYINELALSLERSAAPGLTLHDSQIRCLLYADDLVLLSPTKHGLQQNLDLLEQYCQTWALTVNLKKTNIMILRYVWIVLNHTCKHVLFMTYQCQHSSQWRRMSPSPQGPRRWGPPVRMRRCQREASSVPSPTAEGCLSRRRVCQTSSRY